MKFLFPVLCLFLLLPCFARTVLADEPRMVITPAMQFSYAKELYAAKDYSTAQVEFKRFIYFFPKNEKCFEARFKIGMSLYGLEQYYDASKIFNRIILLEKDDSFTRESYFMQSRAFMKMGNSGYARIVLQNFLLMTDDSKVRDKIFLALADIDIQKSKKPGQNFLDQAHGYLTRISPDTWEKLGVENRIKTIEKAQNAPRKSPTLAGLFSIIPGGGFLYCQRYHDAFVSFLLNGGLIYAAYESFDNGNPALGGVISFVETGFYSGNIYGSISAAHKYNKAQQIKILNSGFNLNTSLDLKNKTYMFSLNHPF
ncbi:MAG: hypothetical protein GY710_01205 [Desulfobacteraceae bacterium]|nr:hypothetical protein [Desulfobacteraceae bacterium]